MDSTSRPPGALVLGANVRALGIARSLGRRGIRTWLVQDPGHDQVARASRYVTRTVSIPSGRGPAKLNFLLETAARHGLGGWTLFPTEDETAALVAQNRRTLAVGGGFTFTTPDWSIYRYAYYKRLTHLLAERAGVAYPWTRYPATRQELDSLQCCFPVILKPDAKPDENPFTEAKAWRVDDRATLVKSWEQAVSLVGAELVMVQELVPGAGEAQYSFAALCEKGVAVASLVARRTRQYPRDFGHSSSLVETVSAPAVEAAGRAVVSALRWNGLVEVEFKRDVRDGSYKLLDINGRVWTWHALGQRAGVDFPYLAWRMAQGLPVATARARPGVRWMRVITDFPSAAGGVRAHELSLRDWASSLRGPRVGPLAALDDPMPMLVDPPLVAARYLRRAVGTRSAGRRESTRRVQPLERLMGAAPYSSVGGELP